MNLRDWLYLGTMWVLGASLLRWLRKLTQKESLEAEVLLGMLAAAEMYDEMQEAEIEEAFETQVNFWCEQCDGLITDPDIDCDHYVFDLS